MKKSYILAAALLAVVGCSKNQVNAPAELYPEGTPVPVLFGAPTISVVTKAVNPETNLVEGDSAAGLEVGVYGLETQDRNLVWDSADETTYIADLLNRNVTIAEDGSITFENPKCYYPLSSEKTFSFYAYYPHRSCTADGNQYNVSYSLGYTDILWAEDHAITFGTSPVYEGFNANYCRYVKQIGRTDLMPALRFEHLLTAIRFIAKTTSDVSNVRVQRLYVTDVNTQATLHVAGEDAGTLEYYTQGGDPATGRIYLRKDPAVATGELAVVPTVGGVELGTLMLEPCSTVNVEVTLLVNNGVSNSSNTVTASLSGNFEAGRRYALTLTVKSPEEVELSTSLVPWDDVTVPGTEF